jgi:hypothetical protein
MPSFITHKPVDNIAGDRFFVFLENLKTKPF